MDAYGHMEWIDGNIGSGINMKYPACLLSGEYAKGTCISIAVASKGQKQDAGAKMIHLAPHTYSTIVSKSVARDGGSELPGLGRSKQERRIFKIESRVRYADLR